MSMPYGGLDAQGLHKKAPNAGAFALRWGAMVSDDPVFFLMKEDQLHVHEPAAPPPEHPAF